MGIKAGADVNKHRFMSRGQWQFLEAVQLEIGLISLFRAEQLLAFAKCFSNLGHSNEYSTDVGSDILDWLSVKVNNSHGDNKTKNLRNPSFERYVQEKKNSLKDNNVLNDRLQDLEYL